VSKSDVILKAGLGFVELEGQGRILVLIRRNVMDRWTDGRTDRFAISISCVSILTCDKNRLSHSRCCVDCCLWKLIYIVLAFTVGVWYLDGWEVSLFDSTHICFPLCICEPFNGHITSSSAVTKRPHDASCLSTVQNAEQSLLLLVTYATDLSLRAIKCYSIVFGVTLKLGV